MFFVGGLTIKTSQKKAGSKKHRGGALRNSPFELEAFSLVRFGHRMASFRRLKRLRNRTEKKKKGVRSLGSARPVGRMAWRSSHPAGAPSGWRWTGSCTRPKARERPPAAGVRIERMARRAWGRGGKSARGPVVLNWQHEGAKFKLAKSESVSRSEEKLRTKFGEHAK